MSETSLLVMSDALTILAPCVSEPPANDWPRGPYWVGPLSRRPSSAAPPLRPNQRHRGAAYTQIIWGPEIGRGGTRLESAVRRELRRRRIRFEYDAEAREAVGTSGLADVTAC